MILVTSYCLENKVKKNFGHGTYRHKDEVSIFHVRSAGSTDAAQLYSQSRHCHPLSSCLLSKFLPNVQIIRTRPKRKKTNMANKS